MKVFWKWTAMVGGVAAIDLLVRFGMPFRMTRVLAVEAVLFPVAAVAFLLLMKQGPPQVGVRRKLQIILIGAFFLAGLRSGLWAAGVPVGTVNLLVLAVAILAWIVYRIRRRATARRNQASLVAQGLHGVDLRGSEGGEIAGSQGHRRE